MGLRLYLIWVLNLFDMYITLYGLSHFPGLMQEANVFMKVLLKDEWSFILVKMVIIGLICVLAYISFVISANRKVRLFFRIMSWFLLVEYLLVVIAISVNLYRCYRAVYAVFVLQMMLIMV